MSADPASCCHHTALRVHDLEAGAAFYVEVFGGRRLTLPFRRTGELARLITGSDVAELRMCHVGLGEGTIELIEIAGSGRGAAWTPMPERNILHFAIQVPDVDLALGRVEAAGGRRLWPVVRTVGDTAARVIYAADPFGNAIELMDVSMESAIAAVLARSPEADPSR